MKHLVIIILFLLPGFWVYAQQEKSYVHKGNKLYQQQKFKEAEENYRKALAKKGQNVPGNFNLGDALYKQKKYAEAGEQFTNLAGASTNNKALLAKAYHNLGNSLLQANKLEESIEAYKKALLNNPKDDQTRYNLAYAQEKLKKQQQQNKQNKNNKDNKDKNNKDKNNKDNKDQNKDNKDKNKDQNKDSKDKNKQNQDKNNPQNQQNKDQQQEQRPQVSKEDAERMLEALNNNEKETQDKLKNKKLKGVRVHITKDW